MKPACPGKDLPCGESDFWILFTLYCNQHIWECKAVASTVGHFVLEETGCKTELWPVFLTRASSLPSLPLLPSEDLGEFMETKGASSPGILVLTTGLSKPFMRLDKYPTLLKELERHMEVQLLPDPRPQAILVRLIMSVKPP